MLTTWSNFTTIRLAVCFCKIVAVGLFLHISITNSSVLALFSASFATSACLNTIDKIWSKGAETAQIHTMYHLSLSICALVGDILTWGRCRDGLMTTVIAASCQPIDSMIRSSNAWASTTSFLNRMLKQCTATLMSDTINKTYTTSLGVHPATTWLTFMPYAKSGFALQFLSGLAVAMALRWTERYGLLFNPIMRFVLRQNYFPALGVKHPDKHVSLQQARGVLLEIAHRGEWKRLRNPEVLRVLTKLHERRMDHVFDRLMRYRKVLMLRLDVFFCMWTLGQLAEHLEKLCGLSGVVACFLLIASLTLQNPACPIITSTLLLFAVLRPELYQIMSLCLSNVDMCFQICTCLQRHVCRSEVHKFKYWILLQLICILLLGSLSHYSLGHLSSLFLIAALLMPLPAIFKQQGQLSELGWVQCSSSNSQQINKPSDGDQRQWMPDWVYI